MTDVVSFRDIALGFSAPKVTAMVTKIRSSFDRRDVFETDNGLSLSVANSYVTERNRMLKAERAVAMFFLALGIEPSDVIERKVASTKMFNAKALKKITELAQWSVGHGHKLERVTRAFIACAIIATENGHDVITNDVNRAFLCSRGFGDRIADADLIEHLDELRLRSMSSGAETQSSQARNVLDVLGLGSIRSIDAPRDAIALYADAPLIVQLRGALIN